VRLRITNRPVGFSLASTLTALLGR